jgi:hypothetical protein
MNFVPVQIIEALIDFIAASTDPDEKTDAAMELIKAAGYDEKWMVMQIQAAYERL